MKVAMVTPWKVKCGIATYSEALSEALAKQGVEVYIMRHPRFGNKTISEFEHLATKTPPDVDVVHVQHEYGLYFSGSNDPTAFNRTLYGGILQHGKPIVTTMHAIGNWSVDSFVTANSKEVITHNKFCKKRFGYPSTIIPHGCNPTENIDKQKAKIALGIPSHIPIVGYVGFIASQKGLETLFEAMMPIKTAGVFIGGGWHTQTNDYAQTLRRHADRLLPGRIQWFGYVPEDKLQIVYSAMDIVVYPSRIATESGALLMALSHGKAVIANDIEPFREKKPALLTFRTIPSLRRHIKRLLKNEDARIELEQMAKEYAEWNSWENVAKKHIELYEGLI